ncbi:transcriptional regulator of acetoin/glycerol metabolism [Blastococcus colisei]|uniref:Transcriptional regulator of acetoin/glycerol metabolism n=1 Tax=Blastococcus colisei TaxID=1564162 RepID=A0A543PDC3_9ACTN|nr:helix-turn-helix domain-containing protein [Blastococcus colisei]TQN42085.1 transcriptional regulator of acetoin/glycerol metabolism [Blastococcus colisei]
MVSPWEQFQLGEETTEGVRAEILTSWRRSRLSGVDPQRVDLPYLEPDVDTRFARAAVPVVARLAPLLVGSDTCLAITNNAGQVLWRWVSDPALRAELDRMEVVEGFSFDEEHAGTNGLGTSLEARRVTMVRGSEHFKEPFHRFTCVAAPVPHPLSRRAVGAVNITCRAAETNDRLQPAVLALVREVQEALLHAAGARERQLFDEFLTSARGDAPVITLGPDVLIANRAAAALEVDRDALWSRVLGAVEDGGPISIPELDDRTASLRLISEGPRISGAVLVLDPSAPGGPPTDAPSAGEVTGSATDRLTALVGRLLADGAGVAVRGEPGTGKRHLLAAALAAQGDEPLVLDAALGSETWAGQLEGTSGGSVLLAHLERLTAADADTLAALLPGLPLRVTATITGRADHLTRLLDALDATVVELPPLRLRAAEVDGMVRAFAPSGARFIPQALAALRDHPWPGNVAELRLAVRTAVAAAGRRPVGVDHLPAAVRASPGGRRLSPLEKAEATVIADVLAACGGNKTAAARALGLARPTLYAKLRIYRL